MPSYKDKKNGTWFCSFYYTSWTGERNRKVKRGFKTKKESQEWEINFLSQKKGDTLSGEATCTSAQSRSELVDFVCYFVLEATCTSVQSRNHIILRLSHISYNCDYCTFQL